MARTLTRCVALVDFTAYKMGKLHSTWTPSPPPLAHSRWENKMWFRFAFASLMESIIHMLNLMVAMMMALGLRVPLSVKEHGPQVWLGKITGHHFWLSNHRLQHHDDTPLNQQGQRKADRERETEINPQTQSDSPDPLSLLLFYWSIIITIVILLFILLLFY